MPNQPFGFMDDNYNKRSRNPLGLAARDQAPQGPTGVTVLDYERSAWSDPGNTGNTGNTGQPSGGMQSANNANPMQSANDYAPGNYTPGNWSFSLPGTQANAQGGSQAAQSGAPSPGWSPWQMGPGWWENDENRDAAAAFASAGLPWLQYLQNSYQYGQDFNEAQRRWNSEFGWTQNRDTWNMGLSGRQQQMAEWQMQQAANQWAQQFGWTQEQDRWTRDITQKQMAQEAALARENYANQLLQARYGAFGRAQAPSGRWQRNWG